MAKSLGLSVMVKPIWSNYFYFLYPDFYDECDQKKYLLSNFSSFKLIGTPGDGGNNEPGLVRRLTHKPVYSDQKITWCQELTHWQPAGAAATYGNKPTAEAFYHAASILVGIPKWGRKRRGYASVQPEEESQENSSEDDGSEDIDIKRFCFAPSAKMTTMYDPESQERSSEDEGSEDIDIKAKVTNYD